MSRAAKRVEQRGDCSAASNRVAIDARDAGGRKERANLMLDALGAEADLFEIRTGALRARLGYGNRVVAVMASSSSQRSVNREGHAAIRTLRRRAALPAEDRGGKTAPIQQNDRLLTAFEPPCHGFPQRRAQDRLGAVRCINFAHVDDTHVGERPIEDALLERDELVPPALRVLIALEGGRGGAEKRHRLRMSCPHHGDVSSVIARTLLLFVRAVVFLVDDDEAEALDRRENCGARADDDVDVAATDALPLVVTLAIREAAMLNCHALAERAPEAAGNRRRERDFGNEHEHAASMATDLHPKAGDTVRFSRCP